MNSNLALESFVGSMTVSDFCARAQCTIEDLVGYCHGGNQQKAAGAPARTKPKAVKPAKVSGLLGSVDTRSAAGRKVFDASLLELLQSSSEGLSGREIEAKTGATLSQVRAAITRLGKKVRATGKTVARRYAAR